MYVGFTVHQLLQSVPWVVFIYRFPLYISYYSVSLGWSLYTGYTVHQLLQCVPLGGLYLQVPLYTHYYIVSLGWSLYTGTLYINYYSVSLGWPLYTGSTVHPLLHCVPGVVFIYRFHCTSTTTVCLLGIVFRYTCHYYRYVSPFCSVLQFHTYPTQYCSNYYSIFLFEQYISVAIQCHPFWQCQMCQLPCANSRNWSTLNLDTIFRNCAILRIRFQGNEKKLKNANRL